MQHITTYFERDRKFYIMLDEHRRYWSIESIFVDNNGKLKDQINGLTGLLSETYEQVIKRTHDRIEIDFALSCQPDRDQLEVITEYYKKQMGV